MLNARENASNLAPSNFQMDEILQKEVDIRSTEQLFELEQDNAATAFDILYSYAGCQLVGDVLPGANTIGGMPAVMLDHIFNAVVDKAQRGLGPGRHKELMLLNQYEMELYYFL